MGAAQTRKKPHPYIHAQAGLKLSRLRFHRPYKSQRPGQQEGQPPTGHARPEQLQQKKVRQQQLLKIQRRQLQAKKSNMDRTDRPQQQNAVPRLLQKRNRRR